MVGGVGVPRPLVRRSGGDGLPLLPPGLLPVGTRRFRMAWAPKLMRRVKGVVGTAWAEAGSSSSMAFSSIESELVEMLLRRRLKGVLTLVGDVPDSPMVEIERRRRWSLMGKAVAVVAVDPFRWNRLVSGLLIELRRWRDMSAGGPFFELSVDIVTRKSVRSLDCYMSFSSVKWVGARRWKVVGDGMPRRVWYVLESDGSSLCTTWPVNVAPQIAKCYELPGRQVFRREGKSCGAMIGWCVRLV